MRSTKVIAFSVPPEFEEAIQEHAKQEHRTISEYLREAIRQYMALGRFKLMQKKVAKKIKSKRLSTEDVEEALDHVRKGA